jgi:hypothetical protein
VTKLAVLALVALSLTGCGASALPSAAPATASALSAASKASVDHEIHLYGAFITGKVTAAKTLTNQDETGKAFKYQVLTVDAKNEREGTAGGKGRVVIRVMTGSPLAAVGQTVSAFVNYPVIDARTGTFINTPGRPYQVMKLTIAD